MGKKKYYLWAYCEGLKLNVVYRNLKEVTTHYPLIGFFQTRSDKISKLESSTFCFEDKKKNIFEKNYRGKLKRFENNQ